MAWQTQGIRFVLYSRQPNAIPDAESVWKIILKGRDPDTIQRNMNVGPGVTQSLAAGAVRGLGLTLTVQPTRIDLFLGSGDSWITGDNSKAPSVKDLVEPVRAYGRKLVEAFPTPRIAVVLELIDLANDWADATAKFAAALPEVKLPDGSSEQTFKVNGVRKFNAAPEVTMNRLCRWESAQYQMMAVAPAVGGGLSPAQSLGQARVGLSLQTDLSSEIRAEVLEPDNAQAILAELCDETLLIAEQGYQRLLS